MIDVKKPLENANLTVNCEYMDLFDMSSHSERKIYLNDEIEAISAHDVIYEILRFNVEDKDIGVADRKPIFLYCTSVGGSVIDGFGIIDAITNSKTPVYTINLAYQYSMGFLIGLAGHKRYAMPNATFLLHDGQNFVWDSSAKCKDQLKFQEKREQRIKEYVLEHSNLTEKEYDENYRVEFYTYADEAKKYGFTDYIIGVDCSLDEVL